MTNDFRLVADKRITDYVHIKDLKTNKRYPIKRIAKPTSRFSKAQWFRAKSPIITDDFNPTIRIEKGVSGEIHYNVWEDVIEIPENMAYCSTLG